MKGRRPWLLRLPGRHAIAHEVANRAGAAKVPAVMMVMDEDVAEVMRHRVGARPLRRFRAESLRRATASGATGDGEYTFTAEWPCEKASCHTREVNERL